MDSFSKVMYYEARKVIFHNNTNLPHSPREDGKHAMVGGQEVARIDTSNYGITTSFSTVSKLS